LEAGVASVAEFVASDTHNAQQEAAQCTVAITVKDASRLQQQASCGL